MAENMDDIVEITDEDGEKYKVEVIDLVTVNDIEYAILSPVDECEDENCDYESDYILMRVKKENDEYSFETIEDDDEFERVAAYIDELADEIEE